MYEDNEDIEITDEAWDAEHEDVILAQWAGDDLGSDVREAYAEWRDFGGEA